MVTRRRFISTTAMAGAASLVPWEKLIRQAYAQIPGGTLAPGDVDKFQLPLIKPPAMPRTARIRSKGRVVDYYEIAVREFNQRILSPGTGTQSLPETKVWSYASKVNPNPVAGGGTLNYPAFTIEASHGVPVRVAWRNELVNANGGYLPHLLDVDPTLHWANPPGGNAGRDRKPTFTETPGPYMGPVPNVTHVHGAHTHQESDGYPEAWYLPAANDIPVGYAEKGTFYDPFMDSSPLGREWGRGRAVFEYPNDQRATTLWYHDHTLGMTRLNVYAGPAGFYLIRGGADDRVRGTLPGPAPGVGDDPLGEYFEIPIVVQDRSFDTGGSLFYPRGRAFFDEYEGSFIPETPVPPIWNPEFFGNMMVVNGFTWPYLDVKKQRYRFRLLNGCNSRFLILKFNDPNVKVWQIGAEGGFLPDPVDLNAMNGGKILMAPAERADVIVDFAEASGEVMLLNLGPDEPFKGFNPDGTLADGAGGALPPADPDSTGQVMLFQVQGGAVMDPSTHPAQLRLPRFNALGDPTAGPRYVSLHEEVFPVGDGDIPVAALLGYGNPNDPKKWSDAPTETPHVGDTEIWEITNFTEDAHPIHIHLVQFQVVGRGIDGTQAPEPWEAGYKDTVIAYPGEITRVKARFDLPGLFVWHCHIVEHEDNEMMRPYTVGGPVGGV